jgi:hypothetical protein
VPPQATAARGSDNARLRALRLAPPSVSTSLDKSTGTEPPSATMAAASRSLRRRARAASARAAATAASVMDKVRRAAEPSVASGFAAEAESAAPSATAARGVDRGPFSPANSDAAVGSIETGVSSV